MTPFGEKVRALRKERSITMKQMAKDLEVSSAYLSALEHGKRGKPGPGFVMQVAGYFHLIWDDAEELKELATLSHPRIVVDTVDRSANATLLANLLSRRISRLDEETILDLIARIEETIPS
ncbi:MAG: helix-turn-helix domain-containing protein [Methylocystaceae bacterium]|nr:helix-turn-helix domain-containing protein [Methylocystaceae bacterium]